MGGCAGGLGDDGDAVITMMRHVDGPRGGHLYHRARNKSINLRCPRSFIKAPQVFLQRRTVRINPTQQTCKWERQSKRHSY